jgi:hypothetical protein
MSFSPKQYNILFWAIISFILFVIIFKWIDYLSNNNLIMECFTSRYSDGFSFTSKATSHTVNLPLTTSYSCKNFCGPTARCSITGQQCMADIDCPGCQPYSPPLKRAGCGPPGDDDAGKLTMGVTPTYSPLTSGYGTHERQISNMNLKPSSANFGPDIWLNNFKEEDNLFNQRFKPSGLQYMPNYPPRYSLTGDFIEDGPIPSNANLPLNQ